MERRYQHDCEQCTLLGHYKEFDLYICRNKHKPTDSTLLARYGNEPREYASTLVGYTNHLFELHEKDYPSHSFALRMAFLIADDLNYLGRYRDAHTKGYRVIKYQKPPVVPYGRDYISSVILNEKEAFNIAYAKEFFTEKDEQNGVRVEIVQIINASDDWKAE